MGEIDGGHPALPDVLFDEVTTGECGGQALERVGHAKVERVPGVGRYITIMGLNLSRRARSATLPSAHSSRVGRYGGSVVAEFQLWAPRLPRYRSRSQLLRIRSEVSLSR